MLNSLITGQKEAFQAQLRPEDSIEGLLKSLLSKEALSTAILLFTEEVGATKPETKALLSLFVFQNLPYACYHIKKDSLKALCFPDYFKAFYHKNGLLSLYPTSPVLFKSLLTIAQCDTVIRASSDVIDNKRLIHRIEQGKQECVLTLTKEEQTSLYYFREGKLRDGYFGYSSKVESSENLRKNLLTQIDPSRDNVSILALYEASGISGTEGQDKAMAQIAAAVPVEDSMWRKQEKAYILDPPEEQIEKTEWGIEFLNGDRAGSILQITQKNCSLGRGKMDLRLDDPQVSRHHADLEQFQGGLTLIDNKSTNGLFVNNSKISKKSLTNNDVIRLGDTSLKVVQRSFNPQARASRA